MIKLIVGDPVAPKYSNRFVVEIFDDCESFELCLDYTKDVKALIEKLDFWILKGYCYATSEMITNHFGNDFLWKWEYLSSDSNYLISPNSYKVFWYNDQGIKYNVSVERE